MIVFKSVLFPAAGEFVRFHVKCLACQSVLCTVIHCRLMDATVYIKGFSHPTLYPVAFLVFPAKKEGSFRRSGEEKGRGL